MNLPLSNCHNAPIDVSDDDVCTTCGRPCSHASGPMQIPDDAWRRSILEPLRYATPSVLKALIVFHAKRAQLAEALIVDIVRHPNFAGCVVMANTQLEDRVKEFFPKYGHQKTMEEIEAERAALPHIEGCAGRGANHPWSIDSPESCKYEWGCACHCHKEK